MRKDKDEMSFEIAQEDTFKLLEKWDKAGLEIHTAFFGSLAVLVGALFHMAPTEKAAEDLLKMSIDMGREINDTIR